jgi:transposase
MASLALNQMERRELEELLTSITLTNEGRRAQALLWLDAGQSIPTVARRLRVSRQTVYNWLSSFRGRGANLDMLARLADRPRSGRPRSLPHRLDPLLAQVLEHDPQEFGYRSATWSAKLLVQHLREVHHIAVNRASIGPAQARLERQVRPAEV